MQFCPEICNLKQKGIWLTCQIECKNRRFSLICFENKKMSLTFLKTKGSGEVEADCKSLFVAYTKNRFVGGATQRRCIYHE